MNVTAEEVSSLLLHAEQDLSCSCTSLDEVGTLQLHKALVGVVCCVHDLQEVVAGARAVRLLLAIINLP